MKVTAALRAKLVELGLIEKSVDDSKVISAALKAVGDGKITAGELAELTADKDDEEADSLIKSLQGITNVNSELVGLVKSQGERLDKIEKGEKGGKPEGSSTETPGEEGEEGTGTGSEKNGKPDGDGTGKDGKGQNSSQKQGDNLPKKSAIGSFLSKFSEEYQEDEGPLSVEVKSVAANYSSTKSAAHYPDFTHRGVRHPLAGQQVKENDRSIDQSSELDEAINGAWVKFMLGSSAKGQPLPRGLRMTEHDRQLVEYALHESKFVGVINGEGSESEGSISVKGRKLSASEVKAVLDDGTSGGLEVAPITFDDAIIMIPILRGEFFPNVNVKTITRGRRVEGGVIGNVTLSSGGADNIAIPLFNTANFISAFDTTIHVVNGSIEIGLDFESDSVPDVGRIVSEQYGMVLANWLDRVVCVGNGSTEPEGIMVASGTVNVPASAGAGGPATVGDYEGLLFGVPKKYKQGFPTNRIMYGANETTYSRARGIAVGASDQRRVFGMNQQDYMLFGHPFGISEDMANNQRFFANMARYRMYRRLGLTMRMSTEGKELIRNNLMLITARARFGGQLEDANAAAVTVNGQA